MRLQDFGVNPKTGKHNKLLTHAESAFVGILWVDHVGEENKIRAKDLACAYAGALDLSWSPEEEKFDHYLARWKRQVRKMQNHLLTEHSKIPIYSRAGFNGGYWVGETKEEGRKFYDTFRQRGLTGLTKASRGKQSIMVEMVQQLAFEFDDLEDVTGEGVVSIAGRSTPIEVADALIRKMMRDPEKFSGELQKLGRRLGSVLMPKEKAREILATTQKLQDLVGGIAGQ